MVTSASISIAERADAAMPFFYLERQLCLRAARLRACGAACAVVPTRVLEDGLRRWLLIVSFALLLLVLDPGHRPRGQRQPALDPARALNFQASELARVLLAHLHRELRGAARGRAAQLGAWDSVKPLGLLAFAAAAAAGRAGLRRGRRCCCVTGFGVLFVAGARLRYVLLVCGVGAARRRRCSRCSCRYRMARVTAFLDPWADPFNSGFQLTQSLIAIGRGEWFGVGLGESVQKLFYLPEAHTDFLFAVLAEELGLVGVAADRWRCSSRWCGAASGIARSPRDAGLHVPGLSRRGLRPLARRCRRSSTSA